MPRRAEPAFFPLGPRTCGKKGSRYMPCEIRIGRRIHECRFRRVGYEFEADETFVGLRYAAHEQRYEDVWFEAPRRYRGSIASVQATIREQARAMAVSFEHAPEGAAAAS